LYSCSYARITFFSEIGVWLTAIRQTPIAPYHATTIQCDNNRKKRRVNSAGDGFIVGKITALWYRTL